MTQQIDLFAANAAYQAGTPMISDAEYDARIEQVERENPQAEILQAVGSPVIDASRKVRLPMVMASMSKVKTLDEITRWMRLKNIPESTLLVITPKYDGISLCVSESTGVAIQRGDNEFGQLSTPHYALVGNKFEGGGDEVMTNGEVVFPRAVFASKYAEQYENGRNTIAGQFNKKEPQPILTDAVYIRYGTSELIGGSKVAELQYLNSRQPIKVPYYTAQIGALTEEKLISLYEHFSRDFELDGLIIEVNDGNLRAQLGRETSTLNPAYARAFKGNFEEVKETVVKSILWNISKRGVIVPILQIEPVKLDGATVSNITGKNARNIVTLGLGAGAVIKAFRSGMVIPEVKEVVKKVPFVMPEIDGVEIRWSASGIDLETVGETDEQNFKKIAAFFEILEIENVSEGIFRQLWEKGYRTIKEIIALTPADLEKLEGFQSRKAQNVYEAIQKSISNVRLSKVQHASGCFKNLGSRKLALCEQFAGKPTLAQVMAIDGFAEQSANEYLTGCDKFAAFIADLPITFTVAEGKPEGGDLDGKSFVFTGVRRADLEAVITGRGGNIGSGVSKNTSYLVMKEKGSGSSKEQKAIALGVQILTVAELEEMLG